MSVEITNLEVIERLVKKRLDDIPKVLESAVNAEARVMVQRTKEGKSIGGQPFIKYSTKSKHPWRDVRIAAGKQVAKVDLTFSGDMFDALRVTITKDRFKILATVFFNEQKQAKKALGHQTGQLGRTTFTPRKFFGFYGKQRENIAFKIRNMK